MKALGLARASKELKALDSVARGVDSHRHGNPARTRGEKRLRGFQPGMAGGASPGVAVDGRAGGSRRDSGARCLTAHATPLKYVIWIRNGWLGRGQIDVSRLWSLLLRRGTAIVSHCSTLTDPEKLNAIVEDIGKRSGLAPREFWKRTLVVAMAMGMTSYEPVANLERIAEARWPTRPGSIRALRFTTRLTYSGFAARLRLRRLAAIGASRCNWMTRIRLRAVIAAH